MSEKSPNERLDQPRSGARRFLRFSLIYAVGDALTKGARIVLIPYYLSVMTTAEIGELAVLQAIIFFAWTVLAFGLGFAVRRYYYDYQEQGKGDCFVSSLWLARLLAGLPVYGILLLLGYAYYEFSGGSLRLNLILLAITAGFLKGGLNIVEFWLNIREEPVKYRAFTFMQFLMSTLIIIYLVSAMRMGVMGVILGELVSYSIFTAVSGVVLFRKSWPDLRLVNWAELFSYCAPVLPHALFMWGLMGIDRLVLNEYVDQAQIGIYEIGYLLGSFLSIVVRSMRAAWIPSYFKTANEDNSKQEFGKIATIYFYVTCFTALCGIFFAPEIVWIFSQTSQVSYAESAQVMRVVLFGFVSMAVFLAINQPLLLERKTAILAMISGFGLSINLLVNVMLIPSLGIWGAAIATVVAYVAMTVATYVVTQRIYQFQFDVGVILSIALCFLGFAITAFFFPVKPIVQTIPVKILLVAGFLVATLFRLRRVESGFLTFEPRFDWTNLSALNKRREIE